MDPYSTIIIFLSNLLFDHFDKTKKNIQKLCFSLQKSFQEQVFNFFITNPLTPVVAPKNCYFLNTIELFQLIHLAQSYLKYLMIPFQF